MHILSIINMFKTQEDCIAFLESKRWKNGVVCPYCKSVKTSKHTEKDRKIVRHQCNSCHKSFSVTVGTIFHRTHLPLQKWLLSISLIADAKKSISARQLARHLDLPVKTAWFLSMRIRNAFKQHNTDLFAGIVEMDETYIKTDEDNDDLPKKRGRGTKKSAVVGIKQKDGGVKAKVVESVDAFTLTKFAKEAVVLGSEVQTDEFRSYSRFNELFNHKQVNHSREYVTADKITTNGLEGFWSLLKRGMQGNFHHISKQANTTCKNMLMNFVGDITQGSWHKKKCLLWQ